MNVKFYSLIPDSFTKYLSLIWNLYELKQQS